ncbi:hypothetical protein N9I81_01360 [Planktomarina temperata]|nr:hypothetical protein [Planktomarina temperata]
MTLDRTPVTSCNLPISTLERKNVGTVEGVLDHQLAAALIRNQAGQCG